MTEHDIESHNLEAVIFQVWKGDVFSTSCYADKTNSWRFLCLETGMIIVSAKLERQLIINADGKVDLLSGRLRPSETWQTCKATIENSYLLQHIPSSKYIKICEQGKLEMTEIKENAAIFKKSKFNNVLQNISKESEDIRILSGDYFWTAAGGCLLWDVLPNGPQDT